MPYQYDNRGFEHNPSNINLQPANNIIAVQSPRRMPQSTQSEPGRAALHRFLDEHLDKADSEVSYDPDSEIERKKRRRQRRRINSISDEPRTLPFANNINNNNNNQQIPHTPVIPQVTERPDPATLRIRYNPYEAGDRAHDISRFAPVELKPKYTIDDQRYTQYSSRSNPPLFYDDSNIADRAATATHTYATPKRLAKTLLETDQEATLRHEGGRINQRQNKFDDEAVYMGTISKTRDEHPVQTRTAWVEPEINNEPLQQGNYRDEYRLAKQSVMNTKNIISSIHNELRYNLPSTENYHA